MLAVHELLNFCLLNVLDVGLAGVEHGNFFGIGVEPCDLVARFRKAQGQRQSHIAAANDADFKLGAFKKLGFPIDRHVFRRTPRSICSELLSDRYAVC